VTAVNCPHCLADMVWSKEGLQWECRCGFVISVDPLLTCDHCASELWWNEKSAQWQCSECCAVIADPLAEDRFISRNNFVPQERSSLF
jgi:hypothetical protein